MSLFSDAGNAFFPAHDACIETIRPRDEEELRTALRAAHDLATPVTFTAALTGLTGGAVPVASGLRVDLTGLATLVDRTGWRRVAPFLLLSETDATQGLVAPGVSLQTLNEALEAEGLWYPPHPGEVRATIGGNVSTNASGPRTYAFGATREYVTSLRIALADGDVLSLRRGEVFAQGRRFTLRTESGRQLQGILPSYTQPAVKNAAGLFVAPGMDLLDLFVGSEGILGAITEVGLRFLPRRPIRSEILFFGNAAGALRCAEALRALKADASRYPDPAGDGLLALEFFDEGSLALARADARFSGLIPGGAAAALEIEVFADDPRTSPRVFALAERLKCVGSLPPGAAGAFRYAVPRRVAELLKERGQPKFGTDFAVPTAAFAELFAHYEEADRAFGRDRDVTCTAKWGHLGDSHLHCNFLCETAEDQERAKALYLALVRKAVALGGTISAEHGVGKKRLADEDGVARPYLWYQYGEAYHEIAEVKRVFDSKGLLNRGNMVEEENEK